MESILTLAIPVVIGLLVVKLLLSQIGCLWKLVVNGVSGFISLWLLNMISAYTGITLEINLVTCLFTGFLGTPGIILLVLGQMM